MSYTDLQPSQPLKPCPFCGGRGVLTASELDGVPELEPVYFVKCYDCDARGSHCDNPFDAEKRWTYMMLQDDAEGILSEEGFIFLTNIGKPIWCRMWQGKAWVFYWQKEHFSPLRRAFHWEIVSFPRNLPAARQAYYRDCHDEWRKCEGSEY